MPQIAVDKGEKPRACWHQHGFDRELIDSAAGVEAGCLRGADSAELVWQRCTGGLPCDSGAEALPRSERLRFHGNMGAVS